MLKTNKANIIFFSLVLCVIYSVYYVLCSSPTINDVQVLGYFAIMQLVYTIWTWYKLEKSVINAYTVFVIALYAFNLGHPMLEPFNLIPYEDSVKMLVGLHISDATYFAATYIGLLFTSAFHIGAVWGLNKKTKIVSIEDENSFPMKMKVLWNISSLLVIVSLPFYLYDIILKMSVVSVYGYMGLYTEEVGLNKYLGLIADFYVPGLLGLYLYSEYYKYKKNIIRTLIIATVLLPPLYLGGRTGAMVIFAVMLIIFTLINRVKLITWVKVGTLLYFLLFVFSIIAKTRVSSDKSMEVYEEAIGNTETNPAVETLIEMGGGIYPLTQVYQIIPRHMDYQYGASYFYASTSIIPNIGFWDKHPAMRYGNLGDWLKEYNNMHYGPGFSIIAEAYYNLGYFGCLIFLLMGFIYCRIFQIVNRKTMIKNVFLFIIAVIFLWLSIKTVRNSFLGTVRALFYICLPIYLLLIYQYRNYKLQKRLIS